MCVGGEEVSVCGGGECVCVVGGGGGEGSMCVCVWGGGFPIANSSRLHNSLSLNCLCVYLSHRANIVLATKARKLVPDGCTYTPAVPTPIHPFTHSQSTRKQNWSTSAKKKKKKDSPQNTTPTIHYTAKSIHHHSNRSHTSLHHCRHHHKDASNIIITIHKSQESVSYKKC